MTQGALADEQRVSKRQRVLKKGLIVLANNSSTIDCTIRNMSDEGAKILCGDQFAVPNEFRFVTLSDNLVRDAKVIWRRGDQIGIGFSGGTRPLPQRKG